MALTQEMREFLQEQRFAVLATNMPDGEIQQTVMWYELRDNDTVIMNTARDRVKDRNVRRDPRVSVCWEDGYRYLTIKGRATVVDDQETAHKDVFALARRYNPNVENIEEEFSHFSEQERVTIVVEPEDVVTNNF